MRISGETKLLFSLKEAAVLSGLSEDKLRREVERGVIEAKMAPAGSAHRLWFGDPEILYFAMLSSLSDTIELSPPTRAKACRLLIESTPRGGRPHRIIPANRHRADRARIEAWTLIHRNAKVRGEWVDSLNREWSKRINAMFIVNWGALIEDVGPRIDLYREGLARIREDDEILGGEPVFDGTRLAVRHVGGMRAKGEPIERILEDYPELTADDIEFARLYKEAHPLVGRPKSGAAA